MQVRCYPFSWGALKKLCAIVCSAVLITACSSPEKQVEAARAAIEKSDYNAAEINLKNALQDDGQLPEARYLLGLVYYETGQYATAGKELARAYELQYSPEKVLPMLLRSLVRAGENDKVINDYAMASVSDKVIQAQIVASRGDAYAANKKTGEATREYNDALKLDPNCTLAKVGLATIKFLAGDVQGASAEAALIAKASPESPEAQGLLAQTLIAQGKVKESIPSLKAAVKANPNSFSTRWSLVVGLMALSDTEAIKEELEAMRALNPKHTLVYYIQAYFALKDNKLDEALVNSEQVLRAAPGWLPGAMMGAGVYMQRKDFVQAQATLEPILKSFPGNKQARWLMVAALLENGQPDAALETLQPVIQDPMSARQLGLVGAVYLANGNSTAAQDYLARALKGTPDSVELKRLDAAALMAGGNADGALALLKEASDQDPNDIRSDIATVSVHMNRKNYDAALAAVGAIERKRPTDANTYYLKSQVYLARGDTNASKQALEKTLSLRPNHTFALLRLAQFDISEGKGAQARKRFEQVLKADSKDATLLLGYAGVLKEVGGTAAEVEDILKRAEKATPNDIGPKLALVRFYRSTNDLSKARQVAQGAAQSFPKDPRGFQALAELQSSTGDFTNAAATVKQLIQLQPKNPTPQIILASVQRNSGDIASAEISLRRALLLQADNIAAQQQLVSLLVEKKDFTGALAIARAMQTQKKGSNVALGHSLEGDILTLSGKGSEAVGAYDKAWKAGHSGDQFARLHANLIKAARVADAQRLADEYLKGNPRDSAGRAYLAERALAEGRYPDAVKLYRELVILQPSVALLANNLAWSLHQIKDAQALEWAEKARKLAPDNPAILDTLGNIQVDRGQQKEGLDNIESAVKRAPKAEALHLSLARAYVKVGRRDDAKRELTGITSRVKKDTLIEREASNLLKTL